jgi:DNA modification methylase
MQRIERVGNATLILGDCLTELQKLPDGAANWCVTSPPYNLNKRYHTSPGAKTKANADMAAKFDRWYADDLPEIEYQAQQVQLLSQLRRVCTDSIFYNHRIRYAWHSRNKDAPPSRVWHPIQWLAQFPIWCEIVWDRAGGSTPTGRYQQGHELIYQIGRPRRPQKSLGLMDVWRFTPERVEGFVCAFPRQLVRNCLRPHALSGEMVVDPYMGSGTTGVVAAELGLSFLVIERDQSSFELALARIQEAHASREVA